MNNELNPWVAAIVMLVFGGLIAFAFWAGGEMALYNGPDHMHRDPRGNIYIMVHDRIVQHSPRGEFLATYDLKQFGVQTVVGDFGFFSNGDLLIRRGRVDLGLLQGIATYLRYPNLTPLDARSEQDGLFRCTLAQKSCTRFGDGGVDFNQAFHVYVDWENDDVYIADTSRHTLRKFDRDGKQVAQSDTDLLFPNQLLLDGGVLYVVNTNNHRVDAVDPSNNNFGKIIRTNRVTPSEANVGTHVWPAFISHVRDHWWVNNKGNDMRRGQILVFDSDWRYQRSLTLPHASDTNDILALDDKVLISDWTLDRVYQFDLDGKQLADFSSPELAAVISEISGQRDHYKWLYYATWGIFAIGIIVGIAVAVLFSGRQKESAAAASLPKILPNDPQIRWITTDQKKERAIRGGALLLATLTPLVPLLAYLTGQSLTSVAIIATFLCATSLLAYSVLLTFRSRIGVLRDMLIVKNHRGETAAGRGEQIVYARKAVVIGPIGITVGNAQDDYDNAAEWRQYVAPLLKTALRVSDSQMQNLLLQRKHPMFLTLIAALLIGALLVVKNYLA